MPTQNSRQEDRILGRWLVRKLNIERRHRFSLETDGKLDVVAFEAASSWENVLNELWTVYLTAKKECRVEPHT